MFEAALLAFTPLAQSVIQGSVDAENRRRAQMLEVMQGQLDMEKMERRCQILEGHLAHAASVQNKFVQDTLAIFENAASQFTAREHDLMEENEELAAARQDAMNVGMAYAVKSVDIKDQGKALQEENTRILNDSYMQLAISSAHVQAHAAIIELERRFMGRADAQEKLEGPITSNGHQTTLRDVTYWVAFAKAAYGNGLTKAQITPLVPCEWMVDRVPEYQPHPQPRPVDVTINVKRTLHPPVAPPMSEVLWAEADLERQRRIAHDRDMQALEDRVMAEQDAAFALARDADEGR